MSRNSDSVHEAEQCVPSPGKRVRALRGGRGRVFRLMRLSTLALRTYSVFHLPALIHRPFPVIHASLLMAVEEQAQRDMHMGRAAEFGHV